MIYKLIIGLGNYTSEYSNTYHNVGFWFVDYIANYYGVNFVEQKIAFVAIVEASNYKFFLIKPKTFMNNSGLAVKELSQKYKIDLNKILIVYDDIDLNLGTFRFREKGSAGTHNGMKSVIYCMKTPNIARLRIGIGENNNMDLATYVLSTVSYANKQLILDSISNAFEFIVNKKE